jgi:hypothetical protein
LILGWLSSSIAVAQNYQNAIEGQVFDGSNGEPAQAVNVYLSNTTIGDVTDPEGKFRIENIPPGNYNLVFHFVGFQKIIREIDIGSKETLSEDAILIAEQYVLDSLQVKGKRDRSWERYLRRFERNFIGTSQNAEQTRLLNPEVLDFEREMWGVYSATAREELHIVNEALGYESFVDLALFKWSYFNDTGKALYFVRMKELEPENKDELESWKTKREATFKESIRYFFNGLISLTENPGNEGVDFRNGLLTISTVYYKNGDKTYISGGVIQQLKDDSKYKVLLPPNEQYDVIGFKFKVESSSHKLSVIPENSEVSYLDYQNRSAIEYIFVVDGHGNLLNPLDVTISGYWGKFRFGDFLPLNYKLEND